MWLYYRFLFTRSSESARYNRKDEKVRPYVDFTDYFRNVEIAKQNGMLPNSLDFDWSGDWFDYIKDNILSIHDRLLIKNINYANFPQGIC